MLAILPGVKPTGCKVTIPFVLVVGRKEAAERTVSVRRLGSDRQSVLPLEAALAALAEEAVPPDVRRIRQAA